MSPKAPNYTHCPSLLTAAIVALLAAACAAESRPERDARAAETEVDAPVRGGRGGTGGAVGIAGSGGIAGGGGAPLDAAAPDAATDVPRVDAPATVADAAADVLMPDVMRRACPGTDTRPSDAADLRPTDAVARADAAVDAGAATDATPARGEVLFVVNKKVLVPGDEALAARLTERGFTVTMMQDADALTETAAGKALVLISASVGSSAVAAKFTAVAVPVVNMEAFVLDDLKMTGPTTMMDYDFAAGQTELFIVNGAHPMAAGLNCYATVAYAPGPVTWGVPGPGAEKVATTANGEAQWAIFGYKQGATMVGATAPARRVGWFASEAMAATLNVEGTKLFDAAVDWALAK